MRIFTSPAAARNRVSNMPFTDQTRQLCILRPPEKRPVVFTIHTYVGVTGTKLPEKGKSRDAGQ